MPLAGDTDANTEDAAGRTDLGDLPFVNILLEATTAGHRGTYTPATGETIDQRLLPIPDRFHGDVETLRQALMTRIKADPATSRFNHNVGPLRMRATALTAENGEVWIVLRRIPPRVPSLDELGIGAAATGELRRWLRRPGLAVVSGTFATGKTWTGCAMLADYVERHGGIAVSLESPTEFFMHGPMGEWGRCVQIPVAETASDAWSRAAADVRKFSPSIVYVGEVSTPAIARVVLGLATTGRPILTTCHGNGHADAIATLASFAEEAGMATARSCLAGSLTGVAQQTMVRGKPVIRTLSLDGEGSEGLRDAVAQADAAAVDAEAERQEAAAMEMDDGADDLGGRRWAR